MTQWIYITVIGLILFLLASFYFFKFWINYKNKFATTQKELKQLQEADRDLREENTTLQNKLRHSYEDTVTNLLGWKLFEDRLTQSVRESARFQLTLGVLFIDIDDFKVINDALSYEVGDALLQEVGKRLQACIRQVDSVSRFTKDTFVILLNQLAKPETAALVSQRILQALSESFQIKEHELYITACIGIAIFPNDGEDPQALLRSADQALHLAKEKGKHLYQFYQQKMHAESQRELSLYTSLSRESVLEDFLIYYQPVVNIKNETVLCMDALLHWQHSRFGLIEGQELFNHIEKQRKSSLILEWLLQNACKQFMHWQTLGFSPPLLGIPLPIKQLEQSQFIYRLSQIMQELAFKPEWLLLEIKDNAAISFDELEKSFNMLHYMGVKIAIDDFGNGFFSLRHLKIFKIDYLKLDPVLISDVDKNLQTVAMLKSLLYLANSLNIQIVIQGVESETQITQLKELGCFLMQGQLLGAPLPEHEVAAKMTATIVT